MKSFVALYKMARRAFVQNSKRFGQLIKPWGGPIGRFLLVAALIVGAWYGFLFLVGPPPIDTTPALIMVWVSVAVALFALFPAVLGRIKKLKLKDFELELQESIEKAVDKAPISLLGLEELDLSIKGDLSRLEPILEQAIRFPSRSVLLLVNLKESHYVSIPMLFVYLFYLDLVGASVVVLFVSTKSRLRSLSDITQNKLVGTVTGKKVLRKFYKQFPALSRIFVTQGENSYLIYDRLFRSGVLEGQLTELVNAAYREIQESRYEFREHLSDDDVRAWFGAELNVESINSPLSTADTKTLLDAIITGDEYIHVFEKRQLNSVVSVCALAKDLAQKTLMERSVSPTE